MALLIGLALCTPPAHARHYPIDTYRSDSGLPQGQVISICQDRRGAIWFGTFSGLCYFDGIRFHTLTWPDGPRGRDIIQIVEGSDGSLWVASSIGISRCRDGAWRDYTLNDGVPDRWINDLLDDGEGGIWLAHYLGLVHLRNDGTVVQATDIDNALGNTVYCLARGADGTVWGGTTGGLFSIRDGECRWFTTDDGLFGDEVYDILIRRSGEVVAGGYSGASRFDGSGRWAPIGLGPLERNDDLVVNAINEGNGGNLNFGTNHGLLIIEADGTLNLVNRDDGLEDEFIHALITDYEDNLWLGTEVGAARLGSHNAVIFDDNEELPSPWGLAIMETPEGSVWITTERGVAVHNDGQFHLKSLPLVPSDAGVNPALVARNGAIWLGMSSLGLLRTGPGGDRLFSAADGLPSDSVTALCEDSRGRIWAGTIYGGARIEGELVTALKEEGLGELYLSQFVEGPDGRLWAVTDQGLFVHDGRSFTCAVTTKQLNFMDPLCLLFTSSGRQLVGTNGMGVVELEDGRISSPEGFPPELRSAIVWALYEDPEGRLWIGTNRGPWLHQDGQFRNVFVELGLPAAEISSPLSIHTDQKGNIWFGCDRGAIRLDPAALVQGSATRHPRLHITGIRINGQDIPPSREIELGSHKDTLEIDFQFFSFRNPAQARYRYRLQGLESADWSPWFDHRRLSFYRLPPGRYQFDLEGISGYGEHATCPGTFSLVVPRPFHMTWAFRVALVLALGALAGLFFHQRQRRFVLERARLESQVKDRTRQFVESEKKYRSLVEMSPLAIAIHRKQRFLLTNHQMEMLTGYDSRELSDQPIQVIVPRNLEGRLLAESRKQESGGEPANTYDIDLLNRDGSRRTVQVFSRGITFEGEPAVMTQFLDITDQKSLEAQFLRVQRMEAVGQLAGSIAHDFNNLLTVIMGYTELSLANPEITEKMKRHLSMITGTTKRARKLTRALLAFSRQQVINLQPVDPNQVVEDFTTMLRQLMEETISFKVQPGGDIRTAIADPGQLEQVLMNLCINARDAMPDGGRITISTFNLDISEDFASCHHWAAEGEFVCIEISDTGIGMSPETVVRIFEPFFSTKPQGEGTGLGLSTVFGIINQHKGLIDVRSQPGKGTTFTICLPVTTEHIPEETKTSAEDLPPGEGTILVVEDQEDVRAINEEMLQAHGFRTVSAENGLEAVELFRQAPKAIDLVLMDLTMPKMGGWDAYVAMKDIDPDVRVVFNSGHATDEKIFEEIRKSGRDLILKPFNRLTLLQTIHRVLNQKPVAG
jgi:PAS domain S-box-containing protein